MSASGSRRSARASRFALAFLVGTTACRGLADPGIDYRCLRDPTPFTEKFDDGYSALLDRCWSAENADAGDIEVGGGDLVIAHAEPALWDGAPPMLFRPIEGEFVVTTRVETLEGRTGSHCDLTDGDAAGIVIRSNDRAFQAALLVHPADPTEPSCLDNADTPSRAVVEARTTGEDGTSSIASDPTGYDGEADIAVCRHMDSLVYFYRDSEDSDGDWLPKDWTPLELVDMSPIDVGSLELGLVTTVSEQGRNRGVEGHFNWVVFPAEGVVVGDCVSMLEDLAKPDDE